MEAVQAMLESQQNKLDSQSSQFFQNQPSYPSFQSQQNDEPIDFEKMIEAIT